MEVIIIIYSYDTCLGMDCPLKKLNFFSDCHTKLISILNVTVLVCDQYFLDPETAVGSVDPWAGQ